MAPSNDHWPSVQAVSHNEASSQGSLTQFIGYKEQALEKIKNTWGLENAIDVFPARLCPRNVDETGQWFGAFVSVLEVLADHILSHTLLLRHIEEQIEKRSNKPKPRGRPRKVERWITVRDCELILAEYLELADLMNIEISSPIRPGSGRKRLPQKQHQRGGVFQSSSTESSREASQVPADRPFKQTYTPPGLPVSLAFRGEVDEDRQVRDLLDREHEVVDDTGTPRFHIYSDPSKETQGPASVVPELRSIHRPSWPLAIPSGKGKAPVRESPLPPHGFSKVPTSVRESEARHMRLPSNPGSLVGSRATSGHQSPLLGAQKPARKRPHEEIEYENGGGPGPASKKFRRSAQGGVTVQNEFASNSPGLQRVPARPSASPLIRRSPTPAVPGALPSNRQSHSPALPARRQVSVAEYDAVRRLLACHHNDMARLEERVDLMDFGAPLPIPDYCTVAQRRHLLDLQIKMSKASRTDARSLGLGMKLMFERALLDFAEEHAQRGGAAQEAVVAGAGDD
jgi:hypothetical protein